MTTPEPFSTDILNIYRNMLNFPLDDFQEQAIEIIHTGDSVVVCAPTGAGKTVIAEFAALKALSMTDENSFTPRP